MEQIKNQYKQSNPEYHGTVIAYTKEQYRDHLSKNSENYISPSYIVQLGEEQKQRDSLLRYSLMSTNNLTPVSNYDISPYNSVGINSMWFNKANGVVVIDSPYLKTQSEGDISEDANTYYEGSTSFGIGPGRLASAAHCFYDGDLHAYPNGGITLWGDANVNGHPHGVSSFVNFKIPTNYGGSKDFVNDYAAATFNMTWGSAPSALTLSTTTPDTTSAMSIGYPGDKQAGDSYKSQGQMVSSYGTVSPDNAFYPIELYHSSSVRAYHGMSGGPLVDSSNNVIGINVFETHYEDGTEYEWGFKRMNPNVVGFLLNS